MDKRQSQRRTDNGGRSIGRGKKPENGYTQGLSLIHIFNDPDAGVKFDYGYVTDDEITLKINNDLNEKQVADMYINGIYLTPTSKCDPGDVATLTISSKEFDSNKIEVAKMVEEAVTYTVEDDDLPVIWAGKDYLHSDEDNNTLEVSVEENTGDILNLSLIHISL